MKNKKYWMILLVIIIGACPLGSGCLSLLNAQTSSASAPSYSGTISVYSYNSFNMFSRAYTSFRKRYDTIYVIDNAPPAGIYSSAKRDCYDAAVDNCADEYCIVVYENFNGFVFIGTYEYLPGNYGTTLKMTGFIAYFKKAY